MHRDDQDVFAPPTQSQPSTPRPPASSRGPVAASSRELAPPNEPVAGAPPGWTAGAIVDALRPLALPQRVERLERALAARLDNVTVVLDNPHDPHNGSAVMRSCEAFGVQQVHVLAEREAFLAARRVAKGTHRWLDLVEHPSPDALLSHMQARGFRLLVTHPEGTLRPEELAAMPRVALVLGNERDGVSQALAERAHGRVGIPMTGFVESLNMSVSAALLVYQATRGRAGDLSELRKQALLAQWLVASVPRAQEILEGLPAR